MSKQITTELKVGAFTVLGISVLVVMVVLLEGNPFTTKVQKFYTQLENVGGVGPRTQVRTSGVPVGEVVSIDVLDRGARVNFEVKGDVVITQGSFLELRSRGVLGDVFIEIVRNTNNTKALPPGSMIPKVTEANDFNSLMTLVGSIARDLQSVSRTLATVFGSSEGKSSLQNILLNVERITAEARDLMTGEKSEIAQTIENLQKATARIASLIERNDGRVDETMRSVSAAAHDMEIFTAQLKSVVSGKNQDKLASIVDSIDASVKNVKDATARVQNIVEKVQKGEGSLGQIVAKDDTANELKQTLKGVQELIAPARRLRVEVDYKGELRTDRTDYIGKTGNHFNVRLSTNPDRYYMLGVTDSPQGRKSTTTTTTTVSQTANQKVVKEVENTEDDRRILRFNVQYAKRFSSVGVRFGLFESYAGVAGDAYFLSDRLTASVEAFNFGDRRTEEAKGETRGYARLKVYSNLFLTPNVYLSGGVDNLGKDPHPIGFMGAGLRFTDDDLKSVIGAASAASFAR